MINSGKIARHLSIGLNSSLVGAMSLGLALHANGATYNFTIAQSQSSVDSITSLHVPVPGSLIGNWDAATNTTGTQTRLGLFGGSGNVAIPTTITFIADGHIESQPAGTFSMEVDVKAGTASFSNFSSSLLTGDPAALDLTLQLLYQTFHTLQPTSIFPGGVPLPLPLGQSTINELTLQQNGDASAGTLTPTGRNHYDFTIALTADLTMQADVLGTPTTLGPIPVPLAVTGTLTLNGNQASATISLSFTIDQTTPRPIPGGTFSNVAFDVPTVLPAGSTAHLLFNGEVASITVSFDLNSAIVAAGQLHLPGDVNSDGHVNVDDLLQVINHWGPCAAPCPSDITGDGVVDMDDLLVVTLNWT